MKKLFLLIALVVSVALVATSCSKSDEPAKPDPVTPENPKPNPDPEPEPEPDPVDEPEVLATADELPPVGFGWNLGNQLDAHVNGVANETSWGNAKATQKLFDKLKADGFTSVRVPVTWLGKVGPAPDYTIDAAWLDRVAEVVGYAENAGLKVIINIHHDGANSEYWLNIKDAAKDVSVNARIKAQFSAMWTQIANRFIDKGDFLIFEPFNELHDGSWGWGANRNDGGKQYTVVNELNQAFVDAVRATGGKNTDRWLVAVGYCANPDLTMSNLVLPTDPTPGRLMVGVHFYDPTEFTLEDKFGQWGHTALKDYKANWGDEDNVEKVFGELKKKYVDNGIPVYIGEIGCVHRSMAKSESFRRYYLEYTAKAAREYGLSYVVWDNGSKNAGKECHGYYTHDNGAYITNSETVIKDMRRGYLNNAKSYTLQRVFNDAPKP